MRVMLIAVGMYSIDVATEQSFKYMELTDR